MRRLDPAARRALICALCAVYLIERDHRRLAVPSTSALGTGNRIPPLAPPTTATPPPDDAYPHSVRAVGIDWAKLCYLAGVTAVIVVLLYPPALLVTVLLSLCNVI